MSRGVFEQRTRSLFEDPGWRTVSMEHRGPDGTTPVALTIFLICPVCACVVPVSSIEGQDLGSEHRAYHVDEARVTDTLLADLAVRREATGAAE